MLQLVVDLENWFSGLKLVSELSLSGHDKTAAYRTLEIPIGNAKLTRMASHRFLLLSLLIGSVLSLSCSTSLFKVKPATELPPLPGTSLTTDGGGVLVRVAPLLTDEETQELFETNLPVGGVLAVRLELNFLSGVPIELKRARFRLRDSQDREWKMLSPKKTVSRIMSTEGIKLYNPNSKKQFENDFGAYALEIKTPLDSGQPKRQGFLFFQTPDKRPVDHGQKLTLVIDGLPQPISITLN